MTDSPIEDAEVVSETPADDQTQAPAPEKYETAFVVLKREDGTYVAASDIHMQFDIERASSMMDVKRGAQDVLDAIYQMELNQALSFTMSRMMPQQNPDHTH